MTHSPETSPEERLYDLSRLVADCLWETGPDGRFTWVSDQVIRVLGKPSQALIGQTFADTFGQDQAPCLEMPFRNHAIKIDIDGGEDRFLSASGVPIFSSSTGEHLGARGAVQDVTAHLAYENKIRESNDLLEERVNLRTSELEQEVSERLRAESKLKIFSEAVEQSPASVIITGVNGKIDYVNGTFTKLTGYSLDEAIGQNPNFLQSGHTPNQVYSDLWEHLSERAY